jgi:hypothetical protein
VNYYIVLEIAAAAVLTAILLVVPRLGGLVTVVPGIVLMWTVLQLVSAVAFCKAIQARKIIVHPGTEGAKETYNLAQGARPDWWVMRHVWAYQLIAEPKSPVGPSAPHSDQNKLHSMDDRPGG